MYECPGAPLMCLILNNSTIASSDVLTEISQLFPHRNINLKRISPALNPMSSVLMIVTREPTLAVRHPCDGWAGGVRVLV